MLAIEEYIQDSSKAAIMSAVDHIGADSDLFDEMYQYIFCDNPQYASRSARIVNYVLERFPFLLDKHINDLIPKIEGIKFETPRGSVLRIFTFYDLPKDEELLSILANLCFDIVDTPSVKIAPKVYALDILYHVSNIEPDLKSELKTMIEIMLPYSSAGIQSRGGKISKKLEKELNMNNL